MHPLRISHVELLFLLIFFLLNNCLINLFKGPPCRLFLTRPFVGAMALLLGLSVSGVTVAVVEELMEAADDQHRKCIMLRPYKHKQPTKQFDVCTY